MRCYRKDTTHLIQRPCYQRGSLCQDPAGSRTTRRPDHRKKTQTGVVRPSLPFIRSGQKRLTRNSERGKKTRQTVEEVGRQHQGMDRPGVRQVPEGSGEQGKLEETGSEIICGTPNDRWWWWGSWSIRYTVLLFHKTATGLDMYHQINGHRTRQVSSNKWPIVMYGWFCPSKMYAFRHVSLAVFLACLKHLSKTS